MRCPTYAPGATPRKAANEERLVAWRQEKARKAAAKAELAQAQEALKKARKRLREEKRNAGRTPRPAHDAPAPAQEGVAPLERNTTKKPTRPIEPPLFYYYYYRMFAFYDNNNGQEAVERKCLLVCALCLAQKVQIKKIAQNFFLHTFFLLGRYVTHFDKLCGVTIWQVVKKLRNILAQ
jgi:hypothetical protein